MDLNEIDLIAEALDDLDRYVPKFMQTKPFLRARNRRIIEIRTRECARSVRMHLKELQLMQSIQPTDFYCYLGVAGVRVEK